MIKLLSTHDRKVLRFARKKLRLELVTPTVMRKENITLNLDIDAFVIFRQKRLLGIFLFALSIK